MITVSLIEDDEDFRELIRRAFRSISWLHLISTYATGEEALRRLPQEKPNVAVVDIKLTGLDGIECIRRLRAISPALPTHFLVLTGFENHNLIFEALKAGAHGYLLKGSTPCSKLLEAIKEVVAGGAPMTPSIARKVISFIGDQERPAGQMTSREQKVFRGLTQGLMYKEISNELSISLDTVRKHTVSIYKKLNVHSRSAAIKYASGQPVFPASTHRCDPRM